MLSSERNSAEYILYKVYWRLCLEDILFYLGFESIQKNSQAKQLLHDFHKRILNYDTIAEESQEVVSKFISEVCLWWALEQGIFVRTSRKQPLYIEDMDLFDLVEIDGHEYTVWELL